MRRSTIDGPLTWAENTECLLIDMSVAMAARTIIVTIAMAYLKSKPMLTRMQPSRFAQLSNLNITALLS